MPPPDNTLEIIRLPISPATPPPPPLLSPPFPRSLHPFFGFLSLSPGLLYSLPTRPFLSASYYLSFNGRLNPLLSTPLLSLARMEHSACCWGDTCPHCFMRTSKRERGTMGMWRHKERGAHTHRERERVKAMSFSDPIRYIWRLVL